MIIEHLPDNYNLCFLSEERLLSLTIDLNKTILAVFITRLVRHPDKTKLNGETTMYCSPDYSKFCETSCIKVYASSRIYDVTRLESQVCGNLIVLFLAK